MANLKMCDFYTTSGTKQNCKSTGLNTFLSVLLCLNLFMDVYEISCVRDDAVAFYCKAPRAGGLKWFTTVISQPVKLRRQGE